jgi:hypothetical protein
MSATAPVRGAAQLRRPGTLLLPAPDETSSPRKATTLPRPRLVVMAPQRTTAGRLPFVILVGAVLISGLVGVLLLHTIAAQDAFRVTSLQQRLATLTDQEQQAAELVAADSSPTALEARAVALGMEPTALTAFHRRSDGRAVGVQSPVYVAPPAPKLTKSQAKAAAHKAALARAALAKAAAKSAKSTKKSTPHKAPTSKTTKKSTPPKSTKTTTKPKPGHSKP